MKQTWQQVVEEAKSHRHHLHRNPELTWQEKETSGYLQNLLDELGVQWKSCAKYGIVATLAPKAAGKHIALRSDMDALPIQEENDLKWKSNHEGCMHACGHDGHMASLIGALKWIHLHEDTLKGPVSFVFQPAEEGGHGAKKMIEDGALSGIDEIYGWHNWPAIPLGEALCPDGSVMSANGLFIVEVTGKGGHSSQPKECVNPITAASYIVVKLQKGIDEMMAEIPSAIAITSFDGSSNATVIPQRVAFSGTVRVAETAMREQIFDKMHHIIEAAAQEAGVSVKFSAEPRYNATVNTKQQADHMRQCLTDTLGQNWLHKKLATPIMASEDFSYYLQEIPGAFALIGTGDEDPKHQVPCHSPNYDFNDNIIPCVIKVFSKIVGVPTPE